MKKKKNHLWERKVPSNSILWCAQNALWFWFSKNIIPWYWGLQNKSVWVAIKSSLLI